MAPPPLRVRPLQADEATTIDRLRRARTEQAQAVMRATIVWRSHQGETVQAIAQYAQREHRYGAQVGAALQPSRTRGAV